MLSASSAKSCKGAIQMSECCSNCEKRTKHRGDDERKSMHNRLRRIEGQVRGLQRMLDEDAYCTDILTQVAAVQSALNSFSRELLENHIRTCVVTDIQNGRDEVITDLVNTIQKLMK